MTPEEEEYEQGITELDQLVRLYARWDETTDKLARLAVSGSVGGVARDELRREIRRLEVSARNLLRLPYNSRVVRRPKPPKPGELSRLLLTQIVRLYMRLPGRADPVEPQHIFALFDTARVPRPADRGRIQRIVRRLTGK